MVGRVEREAAVQALRSPVLVRFFSGVMRRHMAGSFHAVRISHLPDLPRGRPAVVYSNHPSWWDPAFFIVLAAELFPARPGFGPIDAEVLGKYRFMRRIGIFGINPDSPRGGAAFLRTALAVLSDPAAMLWVTAEGSFVDPRRRPVRLRPGTAHLMARLEGAVAVPLAIEYPFWSERRPEALCRFGEPLEAGGGGSVPEWQARLEERLENTADALAQDAIARDPSRFRLLIEGRSGVGGIYDVFRRLRAAARGEAFDPEHRTRRT